MPHLSRELLKTLMALWQQLPRYAQVPAYFFLLILFAYLAARAAGGQHLLTTRLWIDPNKDDTYSLQYAFVSVLAPEGERSYSSNEQGVVTISFDTESLIEGLFESTPIYIKIPESIYLHGINNSEKREPLPRYVYECSVKASILGMQHKLEIPNDCQSHSAKSGFISRIIDMLGNKVLRWLSWSSPLSEAYAASDVPQKPVEHTDITSDHPCPRLFIRSVKFGRKFNNAETIYFEGSADSDFQAILDRPAKIVTIPVNPPATTRFDPIYFFRVCQEPSFKFTMVINDAQEETFVPALPGTLNDYGSAQKSSNDQSGDEIEYQWRQPYDLLVWRGLKDMQGVYQIVDRGGDKELFFRDQIRGTTPADDDEPRFDTLYSGTGVAFTAVQSVVSTLRKDGLTVKHVAFRYPQRSHNPYSIELGYSKGEEVGKSLDSGDITALLAARDQEQFAAVLKAR